MGRLMFDGAPLRLVDRDRVPVAELAFDAALVVAPVGATFVAAQNSVTVTLSLPGGYTSATLRSLEGRGVTLTGPGPHVVAQSALTSDLAATAVPAQVFVAGGQPTGVVVPFLPDENDAGFAPVVRVTPAAVSWNGRQGGDILWTPTVFTGGAPATYVASLRIYDAATGGTSTDGGAIPAKAPTTPIAGKYVAFRETISDPAGSGAVVTWETPRIQVLAPFATGAIATSGVVFLDSYYSPGTQTRTFKPKFAVPWLFGLTFHKLYFRLSPTDWTGYNAPLECELVSPAEFYNDGTNSHPVYTLKTVTDPLVGFDASLVEDNARRERFRLLYQATSGGEFSPESGLMTIPVPDTAAPDPAVPESVFAPSSAEMISAMGNVAVRYAISSGDPGGGGVNVAFSSHTPLVVLGAALAGVTTTYTTPEGTLTARAWLKRQLEIWAGGAMPSGQGGFKSQFEITFVAVVAVVKKRLPSLWAELTAQQRTRLTRGMEACFVGNAAATSPRYPWYAAGWLVDRGIRGNSANLAGAPNFKCPPKLIPLIAAQFFDGGPAEAEQFLVDFDRDTFATALSDAGGLADALATFNQNWTNGNTGRGPTKAELEACFDGIAAATPFRVMGKFGLRDGAAACAEEQVRAVFASTIRPGPLGKSGGEAGPAGGPWASGTYGVKGLASSPQIAGGKLQGALGKILSDGTYDKSAWNGLPNANQPHMATELDTTDGGGGGNPAVRAAMSYAYEGVKAVTVGVCSLAMLGALTRTDSRWPPVVTKILAGTTDLEYRNTHGHTDYCKGGIGSNNSDWPDSKDWRLGSINAPAYMFARYMNWTPT